MADYLHDREWQLTDCPGASLSVGAFLCLLLSWPDGPSFPAKIAVIWDYSTCGHSPPWGIILWACH
jgi:hypothetical protein